MLALARFAQQTGRDEDAEIVSPNLEREVPLAAKAPLYLPTLVGAAAPQETGFDRTIILEDPTDSRTQALAARARTILAPKDALAVVSPGTPPAWLAREWLEGREPKNGAPTAHTCLDRARSHSPLNP